MISGLPKKRCKKLYEMFKQVDRLALGTAQFGMAYGIANSSGEPSQDAIDEMLLMAHKSGIRTLDTAYAYGKSEERIGSFVRRSGKEFNIISKMPDEPGPLSAFINSSLKRLAADSIYGYMLHSFNSIKSRNHIMEEFDAIKAKGIINATGVSLYHTQELDYIIENNIRVDILQIPYNIFDQRFEPYFPQLKNMGIKIYARSVFLQGLFFLEQARIEKEFSMAKDTIDKVCRIASEINVPVHSLCLSFALLNPDIDKVIIGVDSLGQLKKNLEALRSIKKVKAVYEILKSLKLHNEKVILPYKWN